MHSMRPPLRTNSQSLEGETAAAVGVVHALAFGQLASGDPKIALLLLLALEPLRPTHPRHLRLLAYAYLSAGEPERALATLDRLGETGNRSLGVLLRSRALLAAGLDQQAKSTFAAFMAQLEEPAK